MAPAYDPLDRFAPKKEIAKKRRVYQHHADKKECGRLGRRPSDRRCMPARYRSLCASVRPLAAEQTVFSSFATKTTYLLYKIPRHHVKAMPMA